MDKKIDITPDIVLIGAGIMSATLGVLLKLLNPNYHIVIIEKLNEFAGESSNAWNNAGTGHCANCELNYTTLNNDGSMDISKALKIASQFEVSKSFWKYLYDNNLIDEGCDFLNCVPHHSFVIGSDDVAFLQKRFDAMSSHFIFSSMQYSQDKTQLKKWLPLLINNRNEEEIIAATRVDNAFDVDFGKLTNQLFAILKQQDKVDIYLNHEVRNLSKDEEGNWYLKVKDLENKEYVSFTSPFVFIGAGGGSLPLLEKANITEGEGYGGFPVSGQFLVCNKVDVIEQHFAKVYGKAKVGAPPMSVPHLDTRFINGKKTLLFGPFAGFSSKFLKNGSYFDLPASIEFANLFPMLSAGWHNIPLTKYLIQQVMQSPEDRLQALQEFVPDAKLQDWDLTTAGQRVQVIKKDETDGGKLEFGTELICSKDGTIAALLGASPGASTAVSTMLEVIKKCFADKLKSTEWQQKIVDIIPSFGKVLADEKDLFLQIHQQNNNVLLANN